jgi:signal transduction histidine kinase
MILQAGSQLHGLFWPSTYSLVLTTSDVLRFAFAACIAVGGILELRRIAAERAQLLAAEQEQSQRLAELAVLKADFTSMVAHELGNPLAAIRGLTDMLATGALSPADQAHAVTAIQNQTEALTALAADVQAAATVEREDFAIVPRPVLLRALLADASQYARTLPGEHALVTPIVTQQMVWADPDRIGQVLRNLLSNAAKYSPSGTTIELCARMRGERVRIEVVDYGYGIDPSDVVRIFEKFGRGRDRAGRRVAGVGLGLYLSRRIVRAHGSDLTVESSPGAGSTFGFDLETVL